MSSVLNNVKLPSILYVLLYLELVTFSTDTAGQAWFLYQLFHLLQEWSLCHHLPLFIGLKDKHKAYNKIHISIQVCGNKKKKKNTVMPRVPRAFCLIAIAIRFFSALVSLRAASIFKLTSLCSLRASRRFSARVPMPSSLDTCSSLCKFVIESVPMST